MPGERDGGRFTVVARFAMLVAGSLAIAAAARAQDLPAGRVLVLHPDGGAASLRAAKEAGGARWREARLSPRRESPGAPPSGVEQLRAYYLEAEFLRCLAELQNAGTTVDELLEAGHRKQAASAAILGAACALGAEEEGLSRSMVRRAVVAELDGHEALPLTTPAFQTFFEQARRRVEESGRVRVTIQTPRAGARVTVDGGAYRCATPCGLDLRPGDHVLVVEQLGAAPRVLRRRVQQSERLRLALDPAGGGLLRQQLQDALARGQGPDDIGFLRAASMAFGARLVVPVWVGGGRLRVLIYDRARNRVVARTTTAQAAELPVAVRNVVAEWRGVSEPTSLVAEPWFWLGTGGAALAAGIAAYFLSRPGEPRYDLRFFAQ